MEGFDEGARDYDTAKNLRYNTRKEHSFEQKSSKTSKCGEESRAKACHQLLLSQRQTFGDFVSIRLQLCRRKIALVVFLILKEHKFKKEAELPDVQMRFAVWGLTTKLNKI